MLTFHLTYVATLLVAGLLALALVLVFIVLLLVAVAALALGRISSALLSIGRNRSREWGNHDGRIRSRPMPGWAADAGVTKSTTGSPAKQAAAGTVV
ncbi:MULTISPECIES: hypothetical protein [unclassified Arthrobacter]|uniref:hypothetical protein n=1 Tax=unclassified Arthrobacter TaxID=235627 RepID=UPI002E043E20|nr:MULTISPECIES: hypothetical protein [unclassified Arthrobacter]MEC5191887.1 hypothetical protein [Arthrobacter sp. MP_M4]MEC5202392.1 hypothetical protein [Arthrobacter sp. MP_M7]